MPISTPPGLVAGYGGDPEHFQHVFAELHTPAIEKAGYQVIPPAVVNSEVIQAEIFRNLADSDLVVCDMSTLNPNVFFELGVRVTLDRPVAMIKDDRTSTIPFDNAIVSCHTYSSRLDSWRVRGEISRLATWIKGAGAQKRNAMWRHFGAPKSTAEIDSDYVLAIVTLLERTGLSRRVETFDARFDPEHRAVTLVFAQPPTGFLRASLLEEAANLDLDLHLK
jgi:hypothetical protein